MSEASERIKEARERDEAAATAVATTEEMDVESVEQATPQPAPAQPTEAQVNKAFEAAGKSAQRHVDKIAPLMGTTPDQVVACPCCDFPGFIFAQRPPLDGERLMAVKAVIGEEDVRAYRQATNAVQCEECDGYGKLVRPTKNPDQMIAVCPTCNGYGWHAPQQQVQQYTPPPNQQVYYPPAQNGPQQYTPPPVYGQQTG